MSHISELQLYILITSSIVHTYTFMSYMIAAIQQLSLQSVMLAPTLEYELDQLKLIIQEPTMTIQVILHIRYAHFLPDRIDGAITLPASQYMNHPLPAGISFPLADLYQLADFKPPTTFSNVLAKWLK